MQACVAILILLTGPVVFAARLKDLGAWEGVRDNQLVGYGLVVGLAGTGDKRQTFFSAQSLANLLERMGVRINPNAIQVRNTAAVLVTANLPPYAQPGSRLDVQVAAIGDATNLQGGLLVMTPLKAADGQVFAVAQGPVLTGGFRAAGGGNAVSLNHPTAGRIPNGAIVERSAPSPPPSARMRFQLRNPDFTTAARIAEAINRQYSSGGPLVARAENSAVVVVETPPRFSLKPVEFVAEVENLKIEPDQTARIVVNERTGTIVLGKDVRIAPISILHGALSVEIQTDFQVSQPAPLSPGTTAIVPQTRVTAREEKARQVQLKAGATVEDLVKALSAIGSTPRDIIAILQNLKSAGAIEADLEVI
ncbi:MAG: flagellar basal body P-ring protein FlgI [Bryobacteraceae bacterium]|nr:flagellar basal body P-ring protein FlgI [Bryobacteraceae bacterium]MDW8380059.1 flagellar basal body P-ring protein FlgI [Bryobacterales bacterium]